MPNDPNPHPCGSPHPTVVLVCTLPRGHDGPHRAGGVVWDDTRGDRR